MFLIFNKQYREESNLVSDLVKKIKKSQSLYKEYKNNHEIYVLDNIIIEFALTDNLIIVKDKKKNVIVTLDCRFLNSPSKEAELSKARFHMFTHLLGVARSVSDNRLDKARYISRATKTMQAKKGRLDKAAQEKATAEQIITDARQKLKSL